MKNKDTKYKEQLELICQEVNEYIMNQFKYKIPPAYITSGTNIFMSPKAQISIYLREWYTFFVISKRNRHEIWL